MVMPLSQPRVFKRLFGKGTTVKPPWWAVAQERWWQQQARESPSQLRATFPQLAEESWFEKPVAPYSRPSEYVPPQWKERYESPTAPIPASGLKAGERPSSGKLPTAEQWREETRARKEFEANRYYTQLILKELGDLYANRGAQVPSWVQGIEPGFPEEGEGETLSRLLSGMQRSAETRRGLEESPEAQRGIAENILSRITPTLEEAEGWGIDTSSIANILSPQNLMQRGVESWLPQNITQQLRYQIEGERGKQANVLAGVAKEQYPEWWQKYTKERKAMGQDTEEHGWAEENFPVWLQQNAVAVESAGTEYRDKYPELYQMYMEYADATPNAEPFAFWVYTYPLAQQYIEEAEREAGRAEPPQRKATPRWMIG